jgi:hypothetical protein
MIELEKFFETKTNVNKMSHGMRPELLVIALTVFAKTLLRGPEGRC